MAGRIFGNGGAGDPEAHGRPGETNDESDETSAPVPRGPHLDSRGPVRRPVRAPRSFLGGRRGLPILHGAGALSLLPDV